MRKRYSNPILAHRISIFFGLLGWFGLIAGVASCAPVAEREPGASDSLFNGDRVGDHAGDLAGDAAGAGESGDGGTVPPDRCLSEDPQTRGPGETYFVSNSGSVVADGLTPATAWATVSQVNGSSFSPGDCILFNRGDTWNEQLLISSSGSAEANLTFGAYGTGSKPVLDGTGVDLPTNHGLIRGSNKNYIIIENFRVQNSGLGKGSENTGVGFFGGSHIAVRNCEVNNTESSGIKMNANSDVGVFHNDVTMTNCDSWSEQISLSDVNGFEVAYNESYENCNPGGGGGASGTGIDAKGGSKNGTIHHNVVRDLPSTNGIYIDAWNVDTFNIRIYSNYIHNIGRGGIVIGAEAGGALHDVTVHHNIIERSLRGGFVFHNTGPTGNNVYDIFVYNNTVNLNGTEGTRYYGGIRIFDTRLTGVTFKNNILSNGYNFQIGVDEVSPAVVTLDHNVIHGVNVDTGGFTKLDGTNTISGDPLYVSASTGDFHLRNGSPARDACDNSVWQGAPDIKDYEGIPITDENGGIVAPGGRVNCGAHE